MDINDIKGIAIIGGGLMGCGIAQVFANADKYKIFIYDKFSSEDEIRKRINDNLLVFISNNIYNEKKVSDILGNIYIESDLKKAVENAQIIIECVPENMELKQNLLKELELYCSPKTILATNTSVMSVTEIAAKTINKDRVVGMHFWNPPYLIPLVEVVKTESTSNEVMDLSMELLKSVKKHPIYVAKDVPGFVANRLQHSLWREAISIVERGIADVKTVDEAIKMSFGMRLPVLAPLENADMVGTDLTLAIHKYIFKHLENSTEVSPILNEKVENGDLGFKSGKGFYQWTSEDVEKSKKQLIEHLINVLYKK